MADDSLTVKALEKIASHEAEIMRLKIFINEADKLNGLEPRFGDLTAATGTAATGRSAAKRYAAGDFFNKTFSGAVRTIFTDRFTAAGDSPNPASVDEIHEALVQGSFAFETTGADAQKNSIKISLGKNSAMIVKLPGSEMYGLVEWYGKRPGKTGRKANNVDVEQSQSADTEQATEEDIQTDATGEKAAA
jgi:hypothetical protein